VGILFLLAAFGKTLAVCACPAAIRVLGVSSPWVPLVLCALAVCGECFIGLELLRTVPARWAVLCAAALLAMFTIYTALQREECRCLGVWATTWGLAVARNVVGVGLLALYLTDSPPRGRVTR
jgi:hypothetical protein